MTKRNLCLLLLLALCCLFAINVSSKHIVGEYKVLSIDTLKNDVYLIYLYDNKSAYLKCVSLTNTDSISDKKNVTNIIPGDAYEFSLSSIYQHNMDLSLINPLHLYRGIYERGNKIPLENYRDIYLINNLNGLVHIPICRTTNQMDEKAPRNIKSTILVPCRDTFMDSIDASFIKNVEYIRNLYSQNDTVSTYLFLGFAEWKGLCLSNEIDRVVYMFCKDGKVFYFKFSHCDLIEMREKIKKMDFGLSLDDIFDYLKGHRKEFSYGSTRYGRGFFCLYLSYFENGQLVFEITQPNIGYEKFPSLGNYEKIRNDLLYLLTNYDD